MMKYNSFKRLVLKEASVIKMDDLEPDVKKSLEQFIRSNKVSLMDLFDGTHGNVLVLDTKFSDKLSKKDNVELSKVLINATKIKTYRWTSITSGDGFDTMIISIGF